MTSVVEHDRLEQSPQSFDQAHQVAGDPAPAPGKRTLRSRIPAVRTFLVTVALLAGAGTGGAYVLNHRLAESAFVTLHDAVLTADALPVGSTGAGVVTEVLVTEQTRVAVGQELARVRLAPDPSVARRQPTVETLRAPVSGTVSKVDIAVGGVLAVGEPVITLYDHSKLSFAAKATEEELRELRLGMAAQITGPGLDRPVPVVVDHVQARIGPDPLSEAPLTEEQKAEHEQLTVVLVPRTDAVDTVSALVPGLRFTADIDTKTAAGRTPAVNGAG
ncbi:HlyD family efflux transporter periplasmic adaptor subunit [Jidongwangia harbinensis]|uniref:HlyD family efflux transporter periplasmic adaptor subunit n=1 Tax=Jidongwangia harbinensis TaxID=2878561 RepID=UPI001CD9A2F8|nr:HlyD family efflux transporter periplasmic adaptor subunit [Jidongwangia harbinensis]MCA2219269.1 HlyD family efflux transporter periplasmic adaptor subunit [Jidongwangia harbinensis]